MVEYEKPKFEYEGRQDKESTCKKTNGDIAVYCTLKRKLSKIKLSDPKTES